MENCIREYGEAANWEDLYEYLEGREAAEIGSIVRKNFESYLEHETSDFLRYPQYIFRAGEAILLLEPSPNDECNKHRGLGIIDYVYGICVDLLFQYADQEGTKTAANNKLRLAELLSQQTRRLSHKTLVDMAFRHLTRAKADEFLAQPQLLLVPNLLEVLSSVESITMGKTIENSDDQDDEINDYTEYTGQRLCTYWIDRLCCYKWKPGRASSMVSMMRELQINEKQKHAVVNKVAGMLKDIELNEVPPLIYQLFLLLRKDDKTLALKSIIDFFDYLNENPEDSNGEISKQKISEVEGTVLLHLSFSARQDQDIGKSMIKYIKEGYTASGHQAASGPGGYGIASDRLSPFSLACLLSFTQIHKFEDSIYSLLKQVITTSICDQNRITKVAWLKSSVMRNPDNFKDLFLKVVKKSTFGWEQIIFGVVRLSFLLIEHASSPNILRNIGDESSQDIVDMSTETICQTFLSHEFVRENIVEYIASQIPFNSSTTEKLLDLLNSILRRSSGQNIGCFDKLKITFDYLPHLSPSTCHKLILSLTPIIQNDSAYRNNLLLILKKRLFSKSADERRATISSLFSLVEAFFSPLQESQGLDIDSFSLSREGTSVVLDVISMLRRCLSRQIETKIQTYEGFYNMLQNPLVQKTSSIRDSLHSILNVEFMKHSVKGNQSVIQISFHECIHPHNNSILLPIPWLAKCMGLSAILQAQSLSEVGASSSSAAGKSTHDFHQVVEWISTIDLVDFDIDPSSNFSLGDPSGARNHTMASLLLGFIDSAIEYILSVASLGQQQHINIPQAQISRYSTLVPELYEKRARLIDLLRAKSTNELGRKLPVSPFSHSLMSIKTLSKSLERLLVSEKASATNSEPLDNLWRSWRENLGVTRYLIGLTNYQVLTKFDTKSALPEHQTEAIASDLIPIACSVYVNLIYPFSLISDDNPTISSNLTNKTPKTKSILLTACELLAQCMSIISNNSNDLDRCIKEIVSKITDNDAETENQQITSIQATKVFLMQQKRLLSLFISQHPPFIKEAVQLLSISQICVVYFDKLFTMEYFFNKHGSTDKDDGRCLSSFMWWTLSCLTHTSNDDPSLAKQLVKLCLAMVPYFIEDNNNENDGGSETAIEWINEWESSMQAEQKRETKVSTKGQFKPLRQIATDIRCVLGDIDDFFAPPEDHVDDDPQMTVLSQRNILTVTALVVGWLDEEIGKIEWGITQMKNCYYREISEQQSNDVDDLDEIGGPVLAIKAERRISKYFLQLSLILGDMTRVVFKDTQAELLLRCHQKLYKTMASFSKAKIWAKMLPITDAFIQLLAYVGSNLSPVLYDFLAMYQGRHESDDENDGKIAKNGDEKSKASKIKGLTGGGSRSKTKAMQQKSRINRESKLVPGLVFTLEQFERYIIQLGSVSKVKLAHHLRRSTARDFRVDIEQLREVAENDMEEEQGEDESDDSSGVGEKRERGQDTTTEQEMRTKHHKPDDEEVDIELPFEGGDDDDDDDDDDDINHENLEVIDVELSDNGGSD
ncbi:hypothetical protein H4219_005674 [Mycoemilia scoparia]|uniref:FANCI solenoid 4 domain-containing protein n=1 Tax=Mycoemilia scoparia TaxID=417184 RepID=A0A9W8DPM4_9FUNG|nr:hypothetical protein H4219_005674 [Mycoemilia scoparia]